LQYECTLTKQNQKKKEKRKTNYGSRKKSKNNDCTILQEMDTHACDQQTPKEKGEANKHGHVQ
jgi:hypothetical protein